MRVDKITKSRTGKQLVEFAEKVKNMTMEEALKFAANPAQLAKSFNINITPTDGAGVAMDSASFMGIDLSKDFPDYDIAMDSTGNAVFGNNVTPQNRDLLVMLQGVVNAVVAPLQIEKILGSTQVGDWWNTEVIQMCLEHVGEPLEYSDSGNVPINSSFTTEYGKRDILCFENGIHVTRREQLRNNASNIDAQAEKIKALILGFNILLNKIGFFGYQATGKTIFGLLNDANLPAYTTIPTFSGGSGFSKATFTELSAEINTALTQLRQQGKDAIDTDTTPLMLVIASESYQFLDVKNEFGVSLKESLRKSNPNITIMPTHNFDGANGGDNVYYLFAPVVDAGDGSTDGGKSIELIQPTKYQNQGEETTMKGYTQGALCATAGVMTKRPFAVVRRSGC